MKTMILRVKKCGAMTTVQGENGEVNKRMLVLQELGDKWADAFVVAVFRNLATIEFAEGDLVAASLQFRTHDYNGQTYMDIVANEISRLRSK
jgi:hypothetical protein